MLPASVHEARGVAQSAYAGAERRGVGRVGLELQHLLQIGRRGLPSAELLANLRALAQAPRVAGLEQQDPVHRAERAGHVVPLLVDGAQVLQHAHQDLPRLRGAEHARIEADLVAHRRREALLQLRHAEELAAVERIDHQLAVAQLHLAEEVAGKSHALHAQPAALAPLHVDDAERERDAEAAVQHLVEVAVERVVVVVAVAGKSLLVEQPGVEAPHATLRARARGEAGENARRQLVEAAQVRGLVEVGILLARDRQRRPRQVRRLLRQRTLQLQPGKLRSVHGQSVTQNASWISRSKSPCVTGRGLARWQASASAFSTISGIISRFTPACDSLRGRPHAARRSSTSSTQRCARSCADIFGSAPSATAAVASRSSAAARLKFTTVGSISELASPWCVPATGVSACATEWQAPSPFWKAMAPNALPSSICSRASRSLPFFTARTKWPAMRRSPSMAMASASGCSPLAT